jgi:hypothetical protein
VAGAGRKEKETSRPLWRDGERSRKKKEERRRKKAIFSKKGAR